MFYGIIKDVLWYYSQGLTIISVCCFPKNVNEVVNVSGGEELSSPSGPCRSPASLPYGNNCTSLTGDTR